VPGVRTNQAERRFVTFNILGWVGTALSADWMRPSRSLFYTTIHLNNEEPFEEIGFNYNYAMLAPSSRDPFRLYLAHFCLLLLFAISVTYRARSAADVLGILLHGNEDVRDPFEIEMGTPQMALTVVHPEAQAA
jgi:hypothetical protein